MATKEGEKKPTNAFYPTLDGKPPKSSGPSFGFDYKAEKHDKHEKHPKKQPAAVKPQQNDVKYDVHEPQEDDLPIQSHHHPGPGFVPVQLGPGGVAISPYDSVNYNQNLAPQHPGPQNPYGPFYHNDAFNTYEQYDINPNGIPQGKPPAPTSQSDLFNIIGAGVPGSKLGQNNLPPHVRIEHILQHLQHNVNANANQHQQPGGQGPFVHGNNSGAGHPQYVPIVHSGLPPPPPAHGIAIVDGQPVTYGGYPIIPGVGPVATHLSNNVYTSTTSSKGLVAQSTEHGVSPHNTAAAMKSKQTG